MTKLFIAGPEHFITGFQLAGVRETQIINGNAENAVDELLEREDIGILVLPEEITKQLPEHKQQDLAKSVQPVIVVLTKEGGASHLRQDIIRAIGVDLWKGD